VADIPVTAAQHDTVVVARVGDVLAVRLADNPTTGYRWELVPPDAGAVTLDAEGFEPSSAAVGSGGTATWRLRVAQAGRVDLHLKRWRPWEGDRSVIERFDVTVDVTG
jgi:inhibitor of cysteine peptidase